MLALCLVIYPWDIAGRFIDLVMTLGRPLLMLIIGVMAVVCILTVRLICRVIEQVWIDLYGRCCIST